MIEDCFKHWYSTTYPDLTPELDDLYSDLQEAYRAGWKRYMGLEEAMRELTKMSEEDGCYEQ